MAWWRTLESSWRDHRAAFAEGGRYGAVDSYMASGRRWWEFASVVVVVLAVVPAVPVSSWAA